MIAPCPFTWDEWASTSAAAYSYSAGDFGASRPAQYKLANAECDAL